MSRSLRLLCFWLHRPVKTLRIFAFTLGIRMKFRRLYIERRGHNTTASLVSVERLLYAAEPKE